MLEEIRIRSMGVIGDAVLELSPGLNVLSGETGAGKTMIITALNLVLGGKADGSLVRTGTDRLTVSARFQVEEGHPARKIVSDAGAEIEEESAILARSVSDQGRSRALISGSPVNASTLAEIATEIISIHAQSANVRLLKTSAQREILDLFGGSELSIIFMQYQDAYSHFRETEQKLLDIRRLGALADLEVTEYRALVDDVGLVSPQPGELEHLASEMARLDYIDELREAATVAHDAIVGGAGEDVTGLSLLAQAVKALEKVQSRDPNLRSILDRLTEPILIVKEIAGEIASYETSLDADPSRLESLHERRSVLSALLRRHSLSVASDDNALIEIVKRSQLAEEILLGRENLDLEIQAGVESVESARKHLVVAAMKLSLARQGIADQISQLVTVKIRELAMPNAEFSVKVQSRNSEDGLEINGSRVAFSATGVDEVEMLLSAHVGGAPVPLAKGASGGELSRVMLALEVVLARNSKVKTFVFDEVDAGVGGKAAIEVGRQLAELARDAQVIVVTHLAQVAAFADAHYTVRKSEDGLVSESDVRLLNQAERVIELARMLAGQEESDSARRHAEELLEMARRT